MVCDADTVGVFQIESRAQMSMLPRLRPRKFYDLVIEVAIVRPGPIQGDMVHPYLRRRAGLEPAEYPSEALRQVLGKTLGVPLFQEQAMRLVMVAAGFSAEEADRLRKAMAAWRRHGALDEFHPKVVDGMLRNGYTREFAERCFQQIKGFGEYGFPESHAASFALLVYASAWLKRHHPAAFACALLNSQPMGFYAPLRSCATPGSTACACLPVDVNAQRVGLHAGGFGGEGANGAEGAGGTDGGRASHDCAFVAPVSRFTPDPAVTRHPSMHSGPLPSSGPEENLRRARDDKHSRARSCSLHTRSPNAHPPRTRTSAPGAAAGPSLRLGLRMIKGMREVHARQIVECRGRVGAFTSVEQFHRVTGLPAGAVRRLAAADAFGSLPRPRQAGVVGRAGAGGRGGAAVRPGAAWGVGGVSTR